MAFIMVVMLVSRIVLHLHGMKLVPWVGTFFIKTFQMAADLMQFVIVFVIIRFIFAILFDLFIRDETCQIFRNSNNLYIHDSFFVFPDIW